MLKNTTSTGKNQFVFYCMHYFLVVKYLLYFKKYTSHFKYYCNVKKKPHTRSCKKQDLITNILSL